MPEEPVGYDILADKICEKLKLRDWERPGKEFTLIWDTANWVKVWKSFDGCYSSPYAGRVRLDPSASQTMALADDFLNFLTEESELTISLTNEDPLIGAIVSYDSVGDVFFEIVTGQVGEEGGDLGTFLRALRTEAESQAEIGKLSQEELAALLQGADTWELADARLQAQLAELISKLAADNDLRLTAQLKLREYKWQHVIHDHRHYLLFGQNTERIAPKAWFDAAWKFIQHFRCNFGVFLTEAMLYDKVTIVGADNAPVPVSQEDQWFLEEYTGYVEKEDGTKEQWRQVERLNVVNAQQLSDLLEKRINMSVRFEGGDIPPLEPVAGK